MSRAFKIGVLETGRPPEEFGENWDDYPLMVQQWLGIEGAEMQSWPALDGVLPDAPEEADLWVITGSRFGVYEGHPWIAPLEGFIRDCRDAGVPMFGICFGHQLIAQALGGVVRKSAKGWGIGVHDYAVSDWPEVLGPGPESFSIQAFHQDQVEELPEGAIPLASSDFCEFAALWYPGFALTVQGHPEFAKSFASDLLTARRDSTLAGADVDAALASQSKPVTRADLARIVAHWMGQKQS